MTRPLAIDLFCGLGGWTEGLLAEGWDVIGFDIEQHVYGEHRYPAQLVLQDVLTLDGAQFRNTDLIVASPPCQEFSYMGMPWSRAKQIAREYRDGTRDRAKLTALFDACFRVQREACEAAGRRIPLVVENANRAQEWVGRARWHYGSYYLWGDVPALMPATRGKAKVGGDWNKFRETGEVSRFNFISETEVRASSLRCAYAHTPATKPCGRAAIGETQGLTGRPVLVCARHRDLYEQLRASEDVPDGLKTVGHANKRDGHSHTRHLTNQAESDGVKSPGDWFDYANGPSLMRRVGSHRSTARKAASAQIAKIPLALSRHIAHVYYPSPERLEAAS